VETVNLIVLLVQNIGLPGFLLVGGGYWFAKHAWPDIVRLLGDYAQALQQVAVALQVVASRLPCEDQKVADK
jgi:hypothetical protein